MLSRLLAVLSFVTIIGVTIPYMVDIVKGRARPARAARVMFFALMIITLFQQRNLGTGYALAITLGELVCSVLLLYLALKYGVGGFSRSDKICYALLVVDIAVWLVSKNTLIALHLSILADTISFWPTLKKTWHHPETETALFFWGGTIAPIFSLLAQGTFAYQVIVFPLYLTIVNGIELYLIKRPRHSVLHS